MAKIRKGNRPKPPLNAVDNATRRRSLGEDFGLLGLGVRRGEGGGEGGGGVGDKLYSVKKGKYRE